MRVVAATFLIGAFAGACTIFVPRLTSLLSLGDTTGITFWPMPFIVVALSYAAIVGGAAAILYHGKESTPAQRFVAALGVPALFAGSVATTSQAGFVSSLQQTNSSLARVARVSAGIQEKNISPGELVPLDANVAPKPSSQLRMHELLGIGTASAQEATITKGSFTGWATIHKNEPKYLIFLEAKDRKDAIDTAMDLKAVFPGVKAVQTPTGFGVVTDPRPESTAVLEAVNFKNTSGLKPQLIPYTK